MNVLDEKMSNLVRSRTCEKGQQKYPCKAVHVRAPSVQICTDVMIFARTCTDVHGRAHSYIMHVHNHV